MQVLYEDSQIIVIVKPAGVSSEEAGAGDMPSAPFLIREHLKKPNAYIGTVHRLDAGVSGVMVYALSQKAAAALSAQALDGRLQKTYLCLCAGIPEPREGQMHDYLFKDSRQGKVFPVKKERKGAKEALLSYETLTADPASGGTALCRVQLHTGRTHQIRVQFASRKHPLLGDGKYGSRIKGRIALQCASLAFQHPQSGEAMRFSIPAPENWALREE